jgi:CHAT domain-containing protein
VPDESVEPTSPVPVSGEPDEVCIVRSGEKLVMQRNEKGVPLSGYFEKKGRRYYYKSLTLERVLAESHFSKTPLVILSACKVGLMDMARAAEAVSIPCAFLCGGAASVIAGFWPVDDLATCLIMERFYHNLAQGQSRRDALKAAQNHVRTMRKDELLQRLDGWLKASTDPELTAQLRTLYHWHRHKPEEFPFAHPWYWGAFALNGLEG